ncbi:hypothetical protein G6F57_022102 [Rhizopus arrhizus]|nr:hypothetical protein G6F57_022102 [Rhizopus arrhizus]
MTRAQWAAPPQKPWTRMMLGLLLMMCLQWGKSNDHAREARAASSNFAIAARACECRQARQSPTLPAGLRWGPARRSPPHIWRRPSSFAAETPDRHEHYPEEGLVQSSPGFAAPDPRSAAFRYLDRRLACGHAAQAR